MADFAATPQPAVTDEDKTMATLAHVLQVVGWWIAPLIIFIMKRQSRFVSFHALQALLLQVTAVCVWILFMAAFFASFFATVATAHPGPNQPPPTAMFVMFPLMWLFMFGWWGLLLVVAIVYGIKAGRGEWASYPVLGGLARRILKM